MRTNVVPVHIYTRSIFPEKPIPVEGSEHKHNVITFDKSVRIDIPDIEFGYNLETKELMYRKMNQMISDWQPMRNWRSKR